MRRLSDHEKNGCRNSGQLRAGLILAVAVPVTLAVVFNIDPKEPYHFLFGMMPGISIMMLARKLSKGGPKPMPDQIPPGYQFCDQCSKTVLQKEGEMRRLYQSIFISKEAFVCYACNRYRTKKALIILVLFLGFVGFRRIGSGGFLPNTRP